MITITKATERDWSSITSIGAITTEEAHRESCSAEAMKEFLETNYNEISIKAALNDEKNIYHLLNYNDRPIGFSNIILNAEHPNVAQKNTAQLDRIYLLKEYYGLKLGFELLKFNIDYAKNHHQKGIWLFTWVGNTRAVNFYLKAGFRIIGSHQFKVTETHYNDHHQMLRDV